MDTQFQLEANLNDPGHKSYIKKGKRPLLKRTATSKPREFDMGVFDLETDGLGGDFIIACACTEIGSYEYFYNVVDLVQYLLRCKGYIMYAHNGAKFDFLYIANEIKKLKYTHNIQVVRQGEKIIGFVLDDKKDVEEQKAAFVAKSKKGSQIVKPRPSKNAVQLRDSIPLLNSDLFSATKSFAPEYTKLKGDINFEAGEKFDPSNVKHMDYLRRDCDGLLATMRRFYEVCYDMFTVYPSWTAGGTAMKAWKCTIEEGHTYSENKSLEKENFIREAYFGGYVFPGTDIEPHKNVKSVDFNAAYAASMLEGVPRGDGVWTCTFEDKPGFWEVDVIAPVEVAFPCIGKHAQYGLLWPLGNFRTHCSTEEVVYAETKGYRFKIVKGLTFDEIVFPFNTFVAMCQEIEKTVDPETGKVEPARKNIAKQLRNSLYGKFCMRREIDTIIISDEIPELAKFMYDSKGNTIEDMFLVTEENDADYLIPQWGAYIAMRQRLRLFKGMDAVGKAYYCDTDSIKADADSVDKAIEAGALVVNKTKYGCVKDEGTFEWFQALAPKTYHGQMQEHHEMKAKGAPQREMKKLDVCPLCDAANGIYNPLYFTSMHSLQKTLQETEAPLNEVRNRRISNIENSYAWNIDPTTKKICPLTLNEL